MELYEAIATRRSTRKYKDQQITKEQLDKILAAGRMAPTAGDNETTHFIVIQNKEILDELWKMVQEEFARMDETTEKNPAIRGSIKSSKGGHYIFHYNAPTLIVTANREKYANNIADCACAVENMMLEANELDLASCWVNQLRWLAKNDRVRGYLTKLGMKEEKVACAGVVVGYADTEDGLPNRKVRLDELKGNPVTYIQ